MALMRFDQKIKKENHWLTQTVAVVETAAVGRVVVGKRMGAVLEVLAQVLALGADRPVAGIVYRRRSQSAWQFRRLDNAVRTRKSSPSFA